MGVSTARSGSGQAGPDRIRGLCDELATELRAVCEADLPFGCGADQLDVLAETWSRVEEFQGLILGEIGRREKVGDLRSVGYRKAKDFLVQRLGVDTAHAAELAAAAHSGDDLPDCRAAFDEGEISLGQLGAIASGVHAAQGRRNTEEWPDADAFTEYCQARLLTTARHAGTSCVDINAQTRVLKDQADPERKEREYVKSRERRFFDLSPCFMGGYSFEGMGDELGAELFRTVLDAYTPPPEADDERTRGQRRYDALMDVLKGAADAKGRDAEKLPHVLVRINVYAEDDRLKPVTADGRPLTHEALREVFREDVQVRRIIFERATGKPLDVGSAHRIVPKHIREAVFTGHTRCAWPGGCDTPVQYCQADHIQEWAHSRWTAAANTQPLCPFHNGLKTTCTPPAHRRHRHPRSRHRGRAPDSSSGDPPPIA